jgi:hypothetical protein
MHQPRERIVFNNACSCSGVELIEFALFALPASKQDPDFITIYELDS